MSVIVANPLARIACVLLLVRVLMECEITLYGHEPGPSHLFIYVYKYICCFCSVMLGAKHRAD